MTIELTIRGTDEAVAELKALAGKLRVRALRNALAAGARVVQKEARSKTPVISAAHIMVKKGWRTPGTVRRAISVRTSKLARRSGDVGVFVNVRPAKKEARGGKSPTDPFYWRFIEFGTQAHRKGERSTYLSRGKKKSRVHRRDTGSTRAFKFLQAGALKLPQALQVFTQKLRPAMAKLNQRGAPAP